MSTATNSGRDFKVWNFSVTTSGVKIVINDKRVNSFVIQCRTAVDLLLRRSSTGDYFTIKSGSALTLDSATPTLEPFHLTSGSGTVNVEIIGHIE